MARKTRVVYECDKCGKSLDTIKDGLVFHGHVHAPDVSAKPLIGNPPGIRDGKPEETALCWRCISSVAPDPHIGTLQEQVFELQQQLKKQREETHTARAAAEAAQHRPYVETTSMPDYDRPGRGPSGPLVPPELPRAVEVVKALCDLSKEG